MYATLIVSHGLNIQPGQVLNITSELVHRDFVKHIVKAAYHRGAQFVHVDFIDADLLRIRLEESARDEYLRYVPPYVPVKYEGFLDGNTAVLRLVGSEEPDVLVDLPAKKVNEVQAAYRQSLRTYYVEGVGKSKVQWTVASAATPKWAKKVYPEFEEAQAYATLWNDIFHICRVDTKECLALWKKHNAELRNRAKRLTALQIQKLHFTGPGTDLKVVLSPKAIFKGGGDTTPAGIDFEPNIPTEECFTTPDYRGTEGVVRVTRPVIVNGRLIKDLVLEFQKGEICRFTASEGREYFATYIANDPGAKRLGEVALVGIHSPVYQRQRVFQEILLDENAACHIALGFAYRFCLDGGATMTPEELEAIGYNDSHVHTDFMISSEEVDVVATTYSGKTLPLIKKGECVE